MDLDCRNGRRTVLRRNDVVRYAAFVEGLKDNWTSIGPNTTAVGPSMTLRLLDGAAFNLGWNGAFTAVYSGHAYRVLSDDEGAVLRKLVAGC